MPAIASQNQLLAFLSPEEQARWASWLEPVTLRVGDVLADVGHGPAHVYFPVTAVVSLLVPTQDGRCDEVCVVGREGLIGISLFLDSGRATTRAVVQSAGQALRMRAADVHAEFVRSPAIQQLFLRYAMARNSELAQSVVCGRHHTTEQRLRRRLLQGMDRQGGGELKTTQEQLAHLLGVRRESITEEALKLQRLGLIRYSRGQIAVLDRAGLEKGACECYALVKKEYQRLETRPPAQPGPGHAERADLAAHLQEMRDQERGDLARELHDELGSLLTRAKLDLAGLKMRVGGSSVETDQRMQHLGEMLSMGIAFSGRVVESLHPSSLTNLGLPESLKILVREFAASSGVTAQIEMDDIDGDLDVATQLAIYRVVQEALNNVSKYAAARKVAIALRNWGDDLAIAVSDDGRGFDTAAGGTASHGLAGMRHRVEACAGQCTVWSIPQLGTTVVAVIPLRPRAAISTGAPPPPQERFCALANRLDCNA